MKPPLQRVTFYVDSESYLILKSMLALKKKTASAWIRELVENYIGKNR